MRFEEISEDQAYVEGRWAGTDHKATVDKGAAGFTTEAIDNIKKRNRLSGSRGIWMAEWKEEFTVAWKMGRIYRAL